MLKNICYERNNIFIHKNLDPVNRQEVGPIEIHQDPQLSVQSGSDFLKNVEF